MPNPAELQPHPFAELFPAMSEVEIQELAADIRANGLENPITIFEGRILDGVSRHKACLIAGVDPLVTDYRGGDPLAFVLSNNLHRRHLDASQRAMIATKLETFSHGGNRKGVDQAAPVRRKTVANALNVSERSVASAAVVRNQGAPELVRAVEAGSIPVKTAAALAREPVERQRAIIGSMPRDADGKVSVVAKNFIRRAATSTKRAAASKTKTSTKRSAATVERPPNFEIFAAKIEHNAAYLFGKDAPDWDRVIRHKARMPTERREQLTDCLKSIVNKATVVIAELDVPRRTEQVH